MWICLLEIVFVLTIVSSYLPPVALISHYIVVQGIEMVALAVKKFSVVARHHHDKDGTLAISVGDIIELSEEIAALVKSADSCFGPPLILEFTICIVSLVAGLYFVLIAVSIVGSAEGSFHPKAIYLSLSCVGMGFMGLLRLISLIWSGQKFSDQMTLAREQLQDVAIEYHAILSSVESAKLAVMLDRLDKYRNLRPWDGFNLNFSMGLSLIGLLLTYLIVLIQFSLAEN
ncbi:hypothetical protein TCAL_14671 [Tigriopus californicus]|uniref:Gustatory receptor n=1 Tax=Tigriopus californicus TaxID=6832 RepID=A0A553NQU9_TIGCA|nr:hypothetical protein TCAL_14671 [Tigriopus californicus]